MRKAGIIICGAALLVAAALAPAFAQKAGKTDLTGIWTGYTILGDGARADINLTLAKAGEVYTGKITDEMGAIPELAIKNVAFKDPDLTFEIDFPNGAGTQVIKIGLKLEAETLKGSWTDEEGNSNVIELARKK